MNIFAFTELQPRPAYISINQTGPGVMKVSARTRNTDVASEVYLNKDDAVRMANDLLAWAGKQP